MNRESRREIAQETLRILRDGFYEAAGRRIDIAKAHRDCIAGSEFICREDAQAPAVCMAPSRRFHTAVQVKGIATVQAILELARAGKTDIGVLNFASAKNPGGGFLNGAMAQEESLAISSGLYESQLAHPEYYERNRACKTMRYTSNAIYSPNVVFFRDSQLRLLDQPVTACVLTLPAVNREQAVLKGEDLNAADAAMKARMCLVLQLFAEKNHSSLVLGAYGCGVFRNDPLQIARWWKELLSLPAFTGVFQEILFAVLDASKQQSCLHAFEETFGASGLEPAR